jgi:hypothetical protein
LKWYYTIIYDICITTKCGVYEQFQNFESEYKVRISDFMMDQFNTEQSLVYRSGFQSPIDDCAEFVREELLQRLDLIEIKNLMERRKTKQDIWINYMYQALAEKTQKECDSNHGSENCGKPNYGIYLVFYTGAKGKQIDQLQQDLEECIPEEHLINIKVICIDITLT